MPTEPIPFVNQLGSGLEVLGGASPSAMNIVVDATGTVFRRPGIKATELYSGVVDSSGITGLNVTVWGDLLVVGDEISSSGSDIGRHVYHVSGGIKTQLTAAAGQMLEGGGRPSFANSEMISVLVAGGPPIKVDLNDILALLGGSPPSATHVISLNSRLLVNDATVDRTKVNYSGVAQGTTTYAGFEQWNGVGDSDFFTAEGKPDPVVALAENSSEALIFGSETVQAYGPDTSFVFAPLGTLELGCSAPMSVVKVDSQFAFLDHKRRFVMSAGRSFEVISGPIQKTLDAMATTSDCFGYRVEIGPVDALLWTFPSSGVTFAFQKTSGWAQWQGWDGTAWSQCPIGALIRRAEGTPPIVGLLTGELGEMDLNTTTDLGETIRAYIETGYVSRGTERKKKTKAVYLTLRRGNGSGTALLSYRDQPGPWNPPIEVDLGTGLDTETVVSLPSIGFPYRRRQWRFEFSGSGSFALVDAVEDYMELAY